MQPEPPWPFPQADDLDRVLHLVEVLERGSETRTSIAIAFEFDERQADYYASAAAYLGFVRKEGRRFGLTELGRELMRSSLSARALIVLQEMLKRPVFNASMLLLLNRELQLGRMSREELATIIQDRTGLNKTTAHRRAATVKSWLGWVLDNCGTNQ